MCADEWCLFNINAKAQNIQFFFVVVSYDWKESVPQWNAAQSRYTCFFFSSLWGYWHDQRSFLCAGEKILIKVQKCTGSHALSTWFLITLLDMLTGKRRGTGAHFNLRSNLFNWHQLRICAETYVKSCEKKNRFSQLDSPAAQTHYCRCEGLSWQELT